MSGDLTGNFDYRSLINTLRDNGVQNTTSAAKKVGRDNDIDNIKDIDGSDEITIAQSIFNNAIQPQGDGSDTQVQGVSNELLLAYTGENAENIAAGKMMGDGDSVMSLPEIYNDDDYDVVDYDEFYGFTSEESTETEEVSAEGENSEESENSGLDFEAFKAQYGGQFATDTITDTAAQEEALKQIFGLIDTDSNDYIDNQELAAMYYTAPVNEQKDYGATEDREGEDLLGGGLMEMDMQNDSFNPQ